MIITRSDPLNELCLCSKVLVANVGGCTTTSKKSSRRVLFCSNMKDTEAEAVHFRRRLVTLFKLVENSVLKLTKAAIGRVFGIVMPMCVWLMMRSRTRWMMRYMPSGLVSLVNLLHIVLDVVLDSSHLNDVAGEQLRSISTIGIESEWINEAISASWGYGLASRCEELAYEAAMSVLDDSAGAYGGLTPRVEIRSISVEPGDAPIVLNVEVVNAEEEEKEVSNMEPSFSFEIDFAWTAKESSVVLMLSDSVFFEDVSITLTHFVAAGRARITLCEPVVGIVPWSEALITFIEKPDLQWSASVQGARSDPTERGKQGESEWERAPAIRGSSLQNLAVNGLLSLMNQRLRGSAVYPRSVRVGV